MVVDQYSFNARMNNPLTSDDFLLAMQIPGSAIQKQIDALLNAISDEKALIVAIAELFNQMCQKNEDLARQQLEGQILLEHLKHQEEFMYEYIQLRQNELRQQQMVVFETQLSSMPKVEVETLYTQLCNELVKAEEEVFKADDEVKEKHASFTKAAKAVDEVRKKNFASARDELKEKLEKAKSKAKASKNPKDESEVVELEKAVTAVTIMAEAIDKDIPTKKLVKMGADIGGSSTGGARDLFKGLEAVGNKGGKGGRVNFLALHNKNLLASQTVQNKVFSEKSQEARNKCNSEHKSLTKAERNRDKKIENLKTTQQKTNIVARHLGKPVPVTIKTAQLKVRKQSGDDRARARNDRVIAHKEAKRNRHGK